jgi:hypothetical protein
MTTMANAQKLHLNLYGGAMNYQGDLQDKRYTFNQAHLAGGLGLSYDLSDHFSLRADWILGKVSADDKYGRNSPRNLNFTSNITEASLGLQYFLYSLGDHSLTPYVFAGLGVYHFSPYTRDTSGAKWFLQPLSTEGEGFVSGKNMYSLTQVSIPFGGGVKLALSDKINVGLELGFRKLFTDYLDDVSSTYVDQTLLLANRGTKAVELAYRGNELKTGSTTYPLAGTIRGSAKHNDWYYFTGITFSFALGSGNGGGEHGKNSKYGCPANVR